MTINRRVKLFELLLSLWVRINDLITCLVCKTNRSGHLRILIYYIYRKGEDVHHHNR